MSIGVFYRNPSQDGKIYFLKKRTIGFYNIIPHDETTEIKERSDGEHLFIR